MKSLREETKRIWEEHQQQEREERASRRKATLANLNKKISAMLSEIAEIDEWVDENSWNDDLDAWLFMVDGISFVAGFDHGEYGVWMVTMCPDCGMLARGPRIYNLYNIGAYLHGNVEILMDYHHKRYKCLLESNSQPTILTAGEQIEQIIREIIDDEVGNF